MGYPVGYSHQNTVCTSPVSNTCHIPYPLHFSLFFITQIISNEYGPCTLHLYNLYNRYLIPQTPKYPPQHPIVEHTLRTFLPQYDRSTFLPMQNNKQNYSSVYLNLYFWIANWKTRYSPLNDSKHPVFKLLLISYSKQNELADLKRSCPTSCCN